MFCPHCGTKNADGAKFCVSCGTNFGDRSVAPCEPESPVPPKVPPITPPPTGTPSQAMPAPTGAPLPNPLQNQNPKPQIFTASGAARLRKRAPQIISTAVLLLCFFLPVMRASVFGITFSFSPADLAFGKQVFGLTTGSNIQWILFAVPAAASLIMLYVLKEKSANIVYIVLSVIMFAFLFQIFRSISTNPYGQVGREVGLYLSVIANFALVATSVRALVKAWGTKR